MEFNKTATLRNLENLEGTIDGWYALHKGSNNEVSNQLYNDLMFVRGLMDDIECDRITEFPMAERTNLMTGNTFLEEEDTPYFCSPSSETYWSM